MNIDLPFTAKDAPRYGRDVVFDYISDGECDVCKTITDVIAVDSSSAGGTSDYGPGCICGICAALIFGRNTLDQTKRFADSLVTWANSKNHLNSARLSEVGIDDFGDLGDEVPAFKEWMDDFWKLISSVLDDPEQST